MKDIKKILDTISGKEVQSVSVTLISPWDSSRNKMSFNLKIESATLNEVLILKFLIFNRKINNESDNGEFDYLFNKKQFQEEFKQDTYDNFKLEVFGIEPEDLELEYIFK
jgi:hypothetical protein